MKYKIFSGLLIITLGLGLYLFMAINSLPSINNIRGCFKTSMNNIYLCPHSPKYTALENVSPYIKDAIIVSEDISFFYHQGFDLHEIKKSLMSNLSRGRFFRGGSTITQQLAKNLYLNGEKTVSRKIREALLARRIENVLSKNEILEKYLNVVELGTDLYGIKPASQRYFNKSPEDLNILESLYLSHLLPNSRGLSENYLTGRLSKHSAKIISLNAKRLYKYKKLNSTQYNAVLEYLDDFPWYSLSDSARRQLRGDSILLEESYEDLEEPTAEIEDSE